MAIDIYRLNDTKNLIGSIDNFSVLKDELNIFKEQTGIVIDEHGTTRLYVDHLRLLL